ASWHRPPDWTIHDFYSLNPGDGVVFKTVKNRAIENTFRLTHRIETSLHRWPEFWAGLYRAPPNAVQALKSSQAPHCLSVYRMGASAGQQSWLGSTSCVENDEVPKRDGEQ